MNNNSSRGSFMRHASFLMIFCFLGCGLGKVPTTPGIEEGYKARGIEGFDSSGKKVSLESLRGKVVLISFWASWCGPCKALIPHEAAMAKKFSSQPFAILGVNGDRAIENQKKAEEKFQMTWPSISDASGFIHSQWDIDSIPVMYVIDRDGVIRFSSKRVLDSLNSLEELGERVEKEVQKLLPSAPK